MGELKVFINSIIGGASECRELEKTDEERLARSTSSKVEVDHKLGLHGFAFRHAKPNIERWNIMEPYQNQVESCVSFPEWDFFSTAWGTFG